MGPRPCVAPGGRDEGVGRPEHEPEEEGGHDVEDEGGPADDRVGGLAAVAPDEDGRDDGEDEPPQQDRPGQRRPHPGDGVEQRGDRAVVLGHERSAKSCVTSACSIGAGRDEGADEHDGGEQPAVARRTLPAPAASDVRGAAGGRPGRRGARSPRRRSPRRPARRRSSRGGRRSSAGRARSPWPSPGPGTGRCRWRSASPGWSRTRSRPTSSDVKWPTTTTGMLAWKRLGGLPCSRRGRREGPRRC